MSTTTTETKFVPEKIYEIKNYLREIAQKKSNENETVRFSYCVRSNYPGFKLCINKYINDVNMGEIFSGPMQLLNPKQPHNDMYYVDGTKTKVRIIVYFFM